MARRDEGAGRCPADQAHQRLDERLDVLGHRDGDRGVGLGDVHSHLGGCSVTIAAATHVGRADIKAAIRR
jgi:hypothetical protein